MPPHYRTSAMQEQGISSSSKGPPRSFSSSARQTTVSFHADTYIYGKSKTASTGYRHIRALLPQSTKRANSDEDDKDMSSSNEKSSKGSDGPLNGKASIKCVPVVSSPSMGFIRTQVDHPAAQVNAFDAAPVKDCDKVVSVDHSKKTTPSDNAVLLGIVAAVFGVPVDKVVTQDTFDQLMKAGKVPYNGSVDVTLDKVHEVSFIWGVDAEPRPPASSLSISGLLISRKTPTVQVFVKTLTGKTITCRVDVNDTVKELKHQVATAAEIPVEQQRFVFCGKEMEDDRLLLDYNVQKESTVHMVLRLKGGGVMWTVIKSDFLDPEYDYDFTYHMPDTVRFMRGNEIYERPIGWERMAINVTSKYRGDLGWLGPDGIRTFAASDEWPVSYHGTKKEHASDIAGQGLLLDKCKRFAFGRGIYSTPSLHVAEMWAQAFILNGAKMKLIFQNRVNPKTLVKIPKEKTGGIGEYWISPTDSDIRPYGICYKIVG